MPSNTTTDWQGHADLSAHPGYARITLGQFGSKHVNLAEFEGPIMRTSTPDEGALVTSQKPLELRLDMAEALYRALDRVFGKHQEAGVTDALREALKKEQDRVDFFLNRAFAPQVVMAPPQEVKG